MGKGNWRMGLLTLFMLAALSAPSHSAPQPPDPVKSSLKAVTRFTSDDGVEFVIDENAKLIAAVLVVVGDIDIQHIYYKPTITVSDKATVSPASGERQDFINPVKYTVTAEDGSQQVYTAEVAIFSFSGDQSTSQFNSSSGGAPQRLSWSYLVSSESAMLSGTWEFTHSATLEVRQVGSDQVFTLMEQTPTTQTISVKVNDNEEPPTQSSGSFGWSLVLNPDKTYSSSSDQGDSGSGTWSLVDLGKTASLRYGLKLDGVSIIAGGPSVSGVTTWYIVGISQGELYLTKDPIVTSKSTTTFNVTLTAKKPNAVTYQFSATKPGAGGLTLSWGWGTPPFRVQFKETLGSAWNDVATVSQSSYTAPVQGPAGFYRIVGAGRN
jgi:hypothetical protein